jgi:hypothetical protein
MRDYLDLLCESYLDPAPQANVMSEFYHPMSNLRKPMSFDAISGFVSMSDIFNDVCTLVIFILPFLDFVSKMMPFDRYVFHYWSVLQRIIG